jgi:predicted AlkP superfamily pyrophosphatase or phosphodiesterase
VNFHLSDLSNSIFAGLGVEGLEDPLNYGTSPVGRECLILIDGLGQGALETYGSEFPIFSQFKTQRSLQSHFPSTTATNISSLGTGVLPGVHGMLGYTVRVPRSGVPGRLLNSLKWDERVDPMVWQSQKTNFERASEIGISVSHVAAKRYEGSGFTRAALRGARYVGANQIEEMVKSTAQSLRQSPSFAYVYLNNVDHAGHQTGVGSDKWISALGIVAQLIEGLLNELPTGTRITLTADHGMVNVSESIILGQENELMNNVSLVGGEPRARHIYLQDIANLETASYWREFLGAKAEIFTKAEIISSGLLGSVISQDSEDRLGDIVAVPGGGLILIDPNRISQESSMVGHHGGLTQIELRIPLLTIDGV